MALANISRVCSSRLLTNVTKTAVSSRNYGEMAFTFASPGNVYYTNANVKQIDVPTMPSSIGILANHVPTLAVLKPGIVAVHEEDGNVHKYFVSSGSLTINDDSSVQVLAEEAHALDKFDSQAIRDGLSKAQDELSSASSDADKAEAQIAVECFESLARSIA